MKWEEMSERDMSQAILPDGDTLRAESEDFIQLYERIQEMIDGTKGYIRSLMQNDDYAFNVWASSKFLKSLRPKARYYYDTLLQRPYTKEEVDELQSTYDPFWVYKELWYFHLYFEILLIELSNKPNVFIYFNNYHTSVTWYVLVKYDKCTKQFI